MSNRLGGRQGTSYLGTNATQPPNWTFSDRDPNQYDTQNVSLGDLWLNQNDHTVWVLVSLAGNSSSRGSLALWDNLGNSGAGILDTLTGDNGGVIMPDSSSNINIVSDITGLTFQGDPSTHSLTLTSTGGTGALVQSLTANSGGAVSPMSGNINVVGDGTTISIAGNPGTHTLTASLIGGSGAQSFPTDSGTAVPIAGVVNVIAEPSSQHCGSTVSFSASTDTILFNVTDGNNNTIVGQLSGNSTSSGSNNCVFGSTSLPSFTTGTNNVVMGYLSGSGITTGASNSIYGTSSGQNITTAVSNTIIGRSNANLLITGANNVMLGVALASSYTGAESNNIIIGAAVNGVTGESNCMRVGVSTGSGGGQLNKTFIQGIRGITPATTDGIPVFIGSTGQLGTVGTGGTSLIQSITGNSGGAVSPIAGNINVVGDGTTVTIVGNPGTHTLTVSAIGGGGGGAQSFVTDFGTATISGTSINVKAFTSSQNCGSSVAFSGAGSTVQFNVSDANANTIIGLGSGNATLSGNSNTILGSQSGLALTTGFANTVIGRSSGTALTIANNNTICGAVSGQALTTGGSNTIVGRSTAPSLITGVNNVVIGTGTGSAYTTSESNNILIGTAITGTTSEGNALRVGTGTGTGTGQLNKSFIGGIRGIAPAAGNGIPVYIDSNGQLGTVGTGGGGVAGTVSFSAYITNGYTITNGTETPLTYDTVIYNKGSAFNPSTSIFTAPVTGLYNFCAVTWVSLTGITNPYVINRLVASSGVGYYVLFTGNITGLTTSATGTTARVGSFGNSVYVPLNSGDTVYVDLLVAAGGSGTITVSTIPSLAATYFCGQLVST